MDDRLAYLAGERPDDVVIYLADETVSDPGKLEPYGERVEDGLVLVLDGERGRSVFETATGVGAMAFAKRAMGLDGHVFADLTGGVCPEADAGADAADDPDGQADGDREPSGHGVRFLLSFAEAQQDDADDRYGEGDVIHAYAQCECGAAYSEWWLAGERDPGGD